MTVRVRQEVFYVEVVVVGVTPTCEIRSLQCGLYSVSIGTEDTWVEFW